MYIEPISFNNEIGEPKGIKEILFPYKDGKKKLNIKTRIWRFLVPNFRWKSFTFFFSIFWILWNTFIFLGYLLNQYSSSFKDKDYSLQCIQIKYQCGSIVPFHKYDHQYWRPFISVITCDNYGTVIVGFISMWMHGFQFEHIYKTLPTVVTVYFGAQIGVFYADHYETDNVRAEGSCLIISLLMIKGILVFDLYRKSKETSFLLLTIVLVKVIIIFALSIVDLTKTADIYANICAAAGSITLSLAWQKKLEKR